MRFTLGVIAILALVTLAAALAGCVLNPLEPINPYYVDAERGTYSVLAPELRDYIADDTQADPVLKQKLEQLVNDWDAHIMKGETRPDQVTEEAYLVEERDLFDKIAPVYLAYLADDTDLSAGDKDVKADTVASWDLRLKRAERAAGIRAPPGDGDG